MAGRTQEALYAEIDLELSWSEAELPQIARTKHVHGLHPYLGKYVPQLVEIFLERYFVSGQRVYDPFVGSGTTLVEANVFGADAVGCDISAFNCLLSRVKTASYQLGALEMSLKAVLEEARHADQLRSMARANASCVVRAANPWRAPPVSTDRIRAPRRSGWDVAQVILSRSARSARLTTHFDLDFPRSPTLGPYFCHKHKRVCRPVDEAAKFLSRYTMDTVRRIRGVAQLRTAQLVEVHNDDARALRLPQRADGVITSPPYPGLIDYHEQHRYAYELLGLVDRRNEEIGAASNGTSARAVAAYVADMTAVFANTADQLRADAPIVVVVNDSRGLYPRSSRAQG